MSDLLSLHVIPGKHVKKVSHSRTHSVSLLFFSTPLCRVVVIANYSLAISKEMWNIGIRNLGTFCCGIGIWIPSSTDKGARILYLGSGTYSVESRIQDCLGFS